MCADDNFCFSRGSKLTSVHCTWKFLRYGEEDHWVDKIAGAENASDILTRHVDRRTLDKHLPAMGLHIEEGRSTLAPTLGYS